MTLPPDARVRLAADVACMADCAFVDDGEPCPAPEEHCATSERCHGCNGDGTRTVVTDIEVEQVCIAEEGMYEELVWREVER